MKSIVISLFPDPEIFENMQAYARRLNCSMSLSYSEPMCNDYVVVGEPEDLESFLIESGYCEIDEKLDPELLSYYLESA